MYDAYHIPANEILEGVDLCANSAQDFWLTGLIAMRQGSLNHSLGLFILSIEEIGKYKLLLERYNEQVENEVIVEERDFKSHRLKQRMGLAQMGLWGCAPPSLVPLTQRERERLWFVS